jgi:hypothetical protein
VIFHRNHEHGLDLLGVRGGSARRCEKGTHSQGTEKSGVRHENLQGRICAVFCSGAGHFVRPKDKESAQQEITDVFYRTVMGVLRIEDSRKKTACRADIRVSG